MKKKRKFRIKFKHFKINKIPNNIIRIIIDIINKI